MTLAQLYATGYNGSYASDGGAAARLNITTTLIGGNLSIVIQLMLKDPVTGLWEPSDNADNSIYIVMADGSIRTAHDLTLDATGAVLEYQSYRNGCLLADAGITDATGWHSHVTTSGAWDWNESGNPIPGSGSYSLTCISEFNPEMKDGYTLQEYGQSDSNGTITSLEVIITRFEGGVCVGYDQQQTGPGEPKPKESYQRIGDRV